MSAAASAFDQSTYQVRLEWGVEGLRRLAPADIVVVVDVLRFSSRVIAALESDAEYPLGPTAHEHSINVAAIAQAAADAGVGVVLLGAFTNASATAAAVLAEQTRRGQRTSVAIIAGGERDPQRPDAAVRFAVEDLLGAGAIVDALATRGVDHTSPEAAAASESFSGLRRALRHLLTASGSGRELLERGEGADVLAAAAVDASTVVPVLDDGVFRRLS